MPKVPKNYRMDSEVIQMLERIIEVQNEYVPVRFNQTTMLEYLIKTEFENLGLADQQQENKLTN